MELPSKMVLSADPLPAPGSVPAPSFGAGQPVRGLARTNQSPPSPPSPLPAAQPALARSAPDLLCLFCTLYSRAGWSATGAAMSSLTTSSEAENSTPRFVVGSRDDETDFLGSNMKTDETDFFEDDEEEESVRRSWCAGLEHLCRIPGSQPRCAWSLPRAVGHRGTWQQAVWHSGSAISDRMYCVAMLPYSLPRAAVNPGFFARRSFSSTIVDFFVLAT